MRKIQHGLDGVRSNKRSILLYISLAFAALILVKCIGSFVGGTLAVPANAAVIEENDNVESGYSIKREPLMQGFEKPDCNIADVFTDEVKSWEEKICEWSNTYKLEPNIIATVMQVESNGYPGAVSYAGALGLFQVMPYHFELELGEDPFYPDSNAHRGINYLLSQIQSANGSFAAAFAGYNGGPQAREWYLDHITREQYISYLTSVGYSYQVSFNKADQVEKYVRLGIALYQQALAAK